MTTKHHLFKFAGIIACLFVAFTAGLALDNDHDGMDDVWQQRYGIAAFAGALDPDGDGRINLIEAINMTDPVGTANTGPGIVFITDVSPQDGLDDRWQARYGITAADKLGDPDGDGRKNIEESVVGSDPFTADMPWQAVSGEQGTAAVGALEQITVAMPQTLPTWRYTLEVSDTLMDGSWTTVTVGAPDTPVRWGTGGTVSVTAPTGGATRRFYRWKVDNPDTDGDGLGDWQEIQAGTNAAVADSDGDGLPDGMEYAGFSDPLDAASTSDLRALEKGLSVLPTSVFGYFKSVGNDRFSTPNSSSVDWSDSTGTYGYVPYSGMASQMEAKLNLLVYPTNAAQMQNYGWTGCMATSWSYANVGAEHELLYWVKAGVANTARGSKQPWCVSNNFLHVMSSRAVDGSSQSYDPPLLHQFSIVTGQEVSNLTFLEPASVTNTTGEHALILPQVTGANSNAVVDTVSTTGGRNEVPADTPGAPPQQTALAGDTDWWVMLPENTAKSFYFNGQTGSSHRPAYQVRGGDVTAAGATVTNNTIRTSDIFYNWATLTGTTTGYEGAIYAGVAWGSTGTPVWADERPLMRIAVLPEVVFHVKLHPIALVDAGGKVWHPTNCPDAATLQAYLGSVFGVQANVWPTVEKVDEEPVAYDVGIGVNGDNYGAGNGLFEFVLNHTGNEAWNLSAEENAIQAASPRTGADVHVYFVGAEGLHNGSLGMFPVVCEPNESQVKLPVLGHAGKSGHEARGGAVYVWNYNRQGDDPSHLFTIAHEICHYVAQVNHADQQFSKNFMPNSNTETRLMTGREGPRRKLSPKTLIKVEWERMSKTLGFIKDPEDPK